MKYMGEDIVRGEDTYENFKKGGTEMLNIILLAGPGYWRKTMPKENDFGAVLLNTWHRYHAYHVVTVKKTH
jgi:hypothetical protein